MDDFIQGTVTPATKFNIFSGILKTSRSADGKMRLHGVASSTTKDLHGDTMAQSALEDMEKAAANNLTIFLNHSYEVPEDVAGSVERAQMKTRGVDGNGNPNFDLDLDIVVNDANDRAVKAFEAIERGTKLGLSIGALIPEGGAKKEKASGSWVIEHVDLLETSLVGIPANPRSWIEYAVKSLKGGDNTPMTLTNAGSSTNTILWTGTPIQGTTTILEITDAGSCPTCGGSKGSPKGNCGSSYHKDLDPQLTEAMCPTCGKGGAENDECQDPFHKGIEPDVADAQITIEIDTDGKSPSGDDSTSQGADVSTPGTGDGDLNASGDDVAQITASLDPTQIASLAEILQATVSELVDLKKLMGDLTVERDAAVRERDAVRASAQRMAVETQQVLNALASTPLMRRAVVLEAHQALNERLKGVYSEDFLKILGDTNE